jgi:hypothetical protein
MGAAPDRPSGLLRIVLVFPDPRTCSLDGLLPYQAGRQDWEKENEPLAKRDRTADELTKNSRQSSSPFARRGGGTARL